jgi:hypothetical protein
MVQSISSKRKRRMTAFVMGAAVMLALTFNFMSKFRDANDISSFPSHEYVPEEVSKPAVSSKSESSDQDQSQGQTAMVDADLKDSPITETTTLQPQQEEKKSQQKQKQRQEKSETDSDSITVPALDLIESSRNRKKVPASKETAASTPLSSSRSVDVATPTLESESMSAPIPDPLCGGCQLVRIKKKPYTTCGDEINSFMQKSQMNSSSSDLTLLLVQAAVQVAKEYPTICYRCNPAACPASDKLYWRFDQKAPIINYARTHMLSSIPAENRIPASAMADLPTYFSNPDHVLGPNKKYLYEYNPSIVLLPPDQIPTSLVVTDNNDKNKAVYLASYRVTDTNFCWDKRGKNMTNPFNKVKRLGQEWLGLAFLRADLSIIADLTVDLGLTGMTVQDFRLFSLNGNLYISGDAVITPVWINVPVDTPTNQKDIMKLYNMFTNKEDRTENSLTLSVRTFTSCCASPSCKGKNFNYFVGSSANSADSTATHNNETTTKIFVEINPAFPHTIDEVDIHRRCRHVKLNAIKNSLDASVSTKESPPPSHYSYIERYFVEHGLNKIPQSHNRGTAGFVKLQAPNNKRTGPTSKSKELLVGISHQKLFKIDKNGAAKFTHSSYTHNFYAFEQTPPYRVVARSGSFCLGFPSEEENEENHYSQLTRSRPLIMGEEENCPQISFVSGMTEKAGDDSKVILGYGINDCVPRFVEVDKSEIARLLFNTPSGTNS